MTEEKPQDDAFHLAGDRLGKFVILSELGRGSMGVVYEALQDDLKRKVALKILPANITLDAKQVKRFHREAESVARLRHDNIIQIYEVGEIDKTHYFSMELVDGQPLGEHFGRDRESVMRAAKIAMQAARGLAHAHERGVVHRDVKPGNLLVDRGGRVVVTDFGLARLTDSASLTSTDAIVGTPKYMSPEQILPGTKPLDGRTDIYSLAATLFHVLTGRPPFEAPTVQAFIRAILEERAPTPRKFNKQVPHDLGTIILRCLEKDPANRYPSAGALANDLERFLAGDRILAKPKGVIAIGYETVRRHKIIASLSAVAGIAVLLIFVLGGQVDVLQELADIRNEFDLNVAVERIEELRKRQPGERLIEDARVDLYRQRARRRLAEPDVAAAAILADLEVAGQQGTFWHLFMLLEDHQHDRARVMVDALPASSELRIVFLARFHVEDGEFTEAVDALMVPPQDTGPAPLKAFRHFVMARAYRGIALATSEDEERGLLLVARTQLDLARQESATDPEVRLRTRIQYYFWIVRDELKESVSLPDLVADLTGRWLETRRTFAELWGSMSTVEAEIAEKYLDRVLKISNVAPRAGEDLEAQAQARLASASGRDKVVAQLLLGVAFLSRGRPQKALDALYEAENAGNEELAPYVFWGISLAERSRNELSKSLRHATDAIEYALPLTQFTDLESLFRHATLLLEEARRRNEASQGFASFLTKELEKKKEEDWANELLDRVSVRDGVSVPGR